MNQPMKILIAEDNEIDRTLLGTLIIRFGHQPVLARDGQEAIEVFRTESPDLILMDAMMPVMDGFQAAAEIRKIAGNKWVPVIFISANSRDEDKIQVFAEGGDGFVAKPVNQRLLEARIGTMQRIVVMQREVTAGAEQLAQYREENEQEQNLARHLLEKIIRADRFDDKQIERWIHPAKYFSGDVIAAEFTPNNVLHVILADGTGHGLAAALNVLPVIEVFYGMTKKGYGVSNIARELNRKIRQLLPTERFVAATLAAIRFSDHTIEIWNGGMPAACYVDEGGAVLREWHAAHLPLGILDDRDFQLKTEIYHWEEPGRLFLYSDGLPDAQNPEGERFGTDRIRQAFSGKACEDQFWYLVGAVNTFLERENAPDDISVASVACGMGFGVSDTFPGIPAPAGMVVPSEARLFVKLCAAEIRSFDVLPWLISWLSQLYLSPRKCQELFLILSELYNNALDHGLLGLDSALKSQPDGFGLYLDMREERLSGMQQGVIEIELERIQDGSDPFLKIRIKDSGNGYAVEAAPEPGGDDMETPSGRGITLVRTLCESVDILAKGSEIVAVYRLQ